MSDLRSLIIGVVASAIFFVLGFAARHIVSKLRGLSTGRFWRPLSRSRVTLVIGSFSNAEFLKYEPSGVVGIGDLRALDELIELFSRARLPRPKVAYAKTLTESEKHGNLILLGGGDANGVAEDLIEQVGAKVEFVNEARDAPPVLRDVATGRPARYEPDLKDGKVVTDYGVVIRARNPLDDRNWVVIIAGCLGFGTWAGVQLTREPDLANNRSEFVCIYQAAVSGDVPGVRRGIATRKLVRS